MRVEPSLMHPEGGSWTEVRTHTPSKFSKVLHEPLAPIPLERSKFRENGSQPPPNRTGGFHRIRLSPFGPSPGTCPKRHFPFHKIPQYSSRLIDLAVYSYISLCLHNA